jgi:hypothetical protein
MRTILRVFRAARGRFELRVIQFAVLGDHLHLLVEAEGRESLTRGMRGLGTRLAIRLNRTFARHGSLLDDRYHARALRSPLEVRRGLCYVLQNFRKHAAQRGQKVAARWVDPCSSGGTFDGWRDLDPRRIVFVHDLGTLPPRTWLLAIGWRRHGRIGTDELPGATAPPPTDAVVSGCERRAA